MRYLILITIICLFSCDNSHKYDTAIQTARNEVSTYKDSSLIYSYNNGSINIRLDSSNSEFVFQVHKDSFHQTTKLKTYNIGWASPQVIWSSDAYTCILTFSSGQYAEYAFLPLKGGLKVRVVKGGMIETDSVNNLIFYADTAIQNHYTLAFENLLNQRKKTIQLTSFNHDGFKPILDTVILGKSEAIIMDGKKQYRVNLKEINGT